jgi:cell division protein FtsB
MGIPVNLLRKQVVSEVRKRRLVFFTIVLLSFIYLFINLTFGNMGLLRYLELNKTKTRLETEIKEISEENKQLGLQTDLLKKDPFYLEKYAREDFGLAKPDEYIFQYDR